MDLTIEFDTEAYFARLRALGIEYEGDEAWHLQTERRRLQRLHDAQEEAARDLKEAAEARRTIEEESAALRSAIASSDDDALWAALVSSLELDPVSVGGCEDESPTIVPALHAETAIAPDRAPRVDSGASELDWLDELLTKPLPPKDRLPVYVCESRNLIYKNRALFRNLTKQVSWLEWEKKFPFLLKIIDKEDSSSTCNKKKEEREGFHPCNPARLNALPGPPMCKVPAWNKIPALEKRSAQLTEVIAGARFASLCFDGALTPERWLSEVPGEDVFCLSIDLHGDAANRFLCGEEGDVGAALHRGLRRRLERDMGDLEMAAIWVRPHGGAPDDVRIFLLFRSGDKTNARAMEDWDRGKRHFQSLVKHGVKLSDPDQPLSVPDERERAAYLGLTVDEMHDRFPDSSECPMYTSVEEREYSSETGFASEEEIQARAARSHAKWSHFAARHSLPVWLCDRFIERMQDYFVHGPEHVRRRQKLKDRVQRGHHFGGRTSKQDRLELARLETMELRPWYMTLYRGSPAQLAAVAVRSGTVLGDYCDSRHKAGRAKELYEQIRKAAATE